MHDVRIVIFDCDGVLFDTAAANRAYYNHILEHFGRPELTAQQFAYIHMHTVDQALAYLFGDAGLLDSVYAYRRRMDYSRFLKLLKIEPHLIALLEQLKPRFKTAVATNRTDSINRLLEEFNLDRSFDIVVSASDVKRPKPWPDSLLKILAHFQAAARQAVYVGDSELDEQAARAAGMPLVAYRNKALEADFHIDSLMALGSILGI